MYIHSSTLLPIHPPSTHPPPIIIAHPPTHAPSHTHPHTPTLAHSLSQPHARPKTDSRQRVNLCRSRRARPAPSPSLLEPSAARPLSAGQNALANPANPSSLPGLPSLFPSAFASSFLAHAYSHTQPPTCACLCVAPRRPCPLLAHVARLFLPDQLCAIFARVIALFAPNHGRSQRAAVATADSRLSLTALVPVALDAAHLHLSAAPGPADDRRLSRLSPGLKHVAAAPQSASNPSAGRPATAGATPAPAPAPAPAHGLAPPAAAARNAAVLSTPSPRAARPAHHDQHGPSIQCHAIPAAPAARPASPVGRSP